MFPRTILSLLPFFFLLLTTLTLANPFGLDTASSLAAPEYDKHKGGNCARNAGVYDVCDTTHSYLRCRGLRAMMVVDCKRTAENYCEIVNDRGNCNGRRPPSFNATMPPHE
ncbi:hypothetical protein F4778DRAFT_779742 [Xylariomycetidae sp. FL2044]|nr:hypothetical protein F4778DRAFT_779742 [Xylariomycetidae sp. FL2044]